MEMMHEYRWKKMDEDRKLEMIYGQVLMSGQKQKNGWIEEGMNGLEWMYDDTLMNS